MSEYIEATNGFDSLVDRARSLVRKLCASYRAQYAGFSTTSIQVYDTAWVAMITKTVNGEKRWLFPESFQYLLETQSGDGSWGTHLATQTVGILDTAAALLALLRHAAEPLQLQDVVSTDELKQRIVNASRSLRSRLAVWDDVSTTNHIGVELILPSLLEYLEKEDSTLVFDVGCKEVLESMRTAKLSRFKQDSLYSKKPSSAVHSLEAFIGKIDFDRVAHHLFQGSMLASPSSTAAYLMHASHWDNEAEDGLRHIIRSGSGNGNGGIPGTFPTTYFEYSWVVATLLQAGFSRSDLQCPELDEISCILLKAFQEEHGIIGFAPRAPDVDDTAKGILALRLLGKTISPDPMISVFEGKDHFTTFGSERDASFTSNCHVLLALLCQQDISLYSSQIHKTITFICKWWWNCDKHLRDKWHLSHQYPTMLMVQSFTEVLRALDNGKLSGVLNAELQCKVSICLFQACLRSLLEQREDGSWNGMLEQTTHAMLTLTEARRVCFFGDLQLPLESAIARGQAFLETGDFHSMEHHWISKTAYKADSVSEAYFLAASKISRARKTKGEVGCSLGLDTSSGAMSGYTKLVRQTRLFCTQPEWETQASLIESALFVPLLRAQRLDVFQRDDMRVDEDTYLNIIPFTWAGCNNRSRTFASTSWLYDLMVLSLIGFQVDEFIEAVATPALGDNIGKLHELIDQTIAHVHSPSLAFPEPREVSDPLFRFASHVLGHPAVVTASLYDRDSLDRELRSYLHAHTTQIEDNMRFGCQPLERDTYTSPNRSFFQWVRTTAADHVACAYSLAFACCLLSTSLGGGAELFPSAKEKYLAAAAARHLATMCRIYNDYGSVARDSAERNLNSIHFPEFSGYHSLEAKKEVLTGLGEFEHRGLDLALHHLEEEALASGSRVGERKTDVFRLFCDVTDLYDQLYVVRDLSSRMKP